MRILGSLNASNVPPRPRASETRVRGGGRSDDDLEQCRALDRVDSAAPSHCPGSNAFRVVLFPAHGLAGP